MVSDNIDISLKKMVEDLSTKSFKALSSGVGLNVCSIEKNKTSFKTELSYKETNEFKITDPTYFEVDNDLYKQQEKINFSTKESIKNKTQTKVGRYNLKLYFLPISKIIFGHFCDLFIVVLAFIVPTLVMRKSISDESFFLEKNLWFDLQNIWWFQLSLFEIFALVYLSYLVYLVLFKFLVGKTLGQMIVSYKESKQ